MRKIEFSKKYRDIRINYRKDRAIVISFKSKYQHPFFMIIKEYYSYHMWYGEDIDGAEILFQI